jgi:small subunit ribosomal protein S20
MPNTASAAKQARASLKRQVRNRSAVSYLHTIQKRFLSTLSSGKKEEAKGLYPKVVSVLDKAAKRGLIHRNAADRRKSRLAARLKAAA